MPEVVIRSFDRTTLLGGRFRATTIPTFFSFSCIPQAAVVQYSYKEEAGRDGGQSRWESAVNVDKAIDLAKLTHKPGHAETSDAVSYSDDRTVQDGFPPLPSSFMKRFPIIRQVVSRPHAGFVPVTAQNKVLNLFTFCAAGAKMGAKSDTSIQSHPTLARGN